eukprot:1536190-Rhodomonas_salina.2
MVSPSVEVLMGWFSSSRAASLGILRSAIRSDPMRSTHVQQHGHAAEVSVKLPPEGVSKVLQLTGRLLLIDDPSPIACDPSTHSSAVFCTEQHLLPATRQRSSVFVGLGLVWAMRTGCRPSLPWLRSASSRPPHSRLPPYRLRSTRTGLVPPRSFDPRCRFSSSSMIQSRLPTSC